MANTYIAIATVTVGSGGASSIDFTSIPATYTDLCLLYSIRSAGSYDNVSIRFNSNTSSYSTRRLLGNGSSVSSDTASGVSGNPGSAALCGAIPGTSQTANTFGNQLVYIPNYASSNYKSVSCDSVDENNATGANTELTASLWSNTSAITSIRLLGYHGNNFAQYSTATLYGIKNS
jgi:hypothetical protein